MSDESLLRMAEVRIAELEHELFGYRQMASRYEESDELHVRLRKAERLADAVDAVDLSDLRNITVPIADLVAVLRHLYIWQALNDTLREFRDTEDAK